MRDGNPDRRQFLVQISRTALTVAAASALSSCADATGGGGGNGPITVDVSALTQDGQALVTSVNGPDGAPVLVVRSAAGAFVALSMLCTHQGCALNDPTSAGVLFCPCHGSEFNLQGGVLRGPANRPLTRLTSTFDATTDKLTITF